MTIYGSRFGSTAGSVSFGGHNVGSHNFTGSNPGYSWSNTSIGLLIPSSSQPGTVVGDGNDQWRDRPATPTPTRSREILSQGRKTNATMRRGTARTRRRTTGKRILRKRRKSRRIPLETEDETGAAPILQRTSRGCERRVVGRRPAGCLPLRAFRASLSPQVPSMRSHPRDGRHPTIPFP